MSASVMVYKYLKAHHAIDLTEQGKLRVGTLGDFRSNKTLDPAIRDANEGLRVSYVDPDTFDLRKPDEVPAIVKELIKVPPEGVGIVFKDIGFQVEVESPDYYIYSVSTECSSGLMKRLQYDACVAIRDPQEFFQSLTNQLVREWGVLQAWFEPCIYASRRQHHLAEPAGHPALLKDPSDQQNREVRGLWKPSKVPIHPVVLTIPELTKYCEVIVPR